MTWLGTRPDDGFYVGHGEGGVGANGHLFEGNYVHDCDTRQCYGFHLYKYIFNAVVRRNRVERALHGGIMSFGDGGKVYSNIFRNNAGVGFGNQGSGTLFYGNTFAENQDGVSVFNGGATVLKNNIFSSTGDASSIGPNGGTYSGAQSNLCHNSSGTQCTHTTSDPQFVSAPLGDYHLKPTSPAIDIGATLGPPFDTDIEGFPTLRTIRRWGA